MEDWLERVNDPELGSPLCLEPDFQRAHVWTVEQQINYVEFRLRGGSSGSTLYFNCPSWMDGFRHPLVLVDGLQRITAARKFMANELSVFGGIFLSDFEDKIPFELSFTINVNKLQTDVEVLQWYLEMNSGGTAHTDAELDKVRAMIERAS